MTGRGCKSAFKFDPVSAPIRRVSDWIPML